MSYYIIDFTGIDQDFHMSNRDLNKKYKLPSDANTTATTEEAHWLTGLYYERGMKDRRRDYVKALEFYEKIVTDPTLISHAKHRRAVIKMKDRLTWSDGIALLQESTCPAAKYELGIAKISGKSIEQDSVAGFALLVRADTSQAHIKMGDMCYSGEGTEESVEEALKHYAKGCIGERCGKIVHLLDNESRIGNEKLASDLVNAMYPEVANVKPDKNV